MANPVTGPVHEQDEASDQVCVQSHVNSGGGDCGDSYLWVTKKTAFPEICAPGGAPACTFNITVQALCKAFNGPVLFGDGVFSGSSTVAPAITSITNNASPAICAWSGGWSSTTAPSYCAANISLPLNQTITFTVTLGPPLPTLPAGGKYTNCFVADGKTPVPANFPAAYADVNPNTSPNGGLWGNCTPFNVVSSQGLVVCPTGSTLRGAECVRTPPACAPPMVPGAVPGQCVCPQGTVLRGKECVGQTSCQPPMVPGAVPGQCVCPQGTVLRGRECVRQTTCQPPMVPGAVPGQCVCPQGTVQHGGACVKQIVCRPPMVQNASGTVCVCPAGSVRRGGQCVQPLACRAPMIPNSATTACVCPAGTVQKGRQCVVPTVCDPPAHLNRRGACECPRDMVAIGRTCAPRERRPQPSVTPGEFPRGAPAGPRPGGRRPMDQPERR
jgi:hypothetical protein